MTAQTAAFDAPREAAPLALNDFLPFRLTLAAQAVSQLFAATCEDRFGISIPAWRILCLLAEHGALEPRDLGYRAVLEEAQVQAAAASLAARGLIGRIRTGPDGAEPRLAITEPGRAVQAELAELALAAQAALLAGLSPEEVRTLHRLLGRVQVAALKLSGHAPA